MRGEYERTAAEEARAARLDRWLHRHPEYADESVDEHDMPDDEASHDEEAA